MCENPSLTEPTSLLRPASAAAAAVEVTELGQPLVHRGELPLEPRGALRPKVEAQPPAAGHDDARRDAAEGAEALEGRISLESKRDIRLATTHATHAAAEAVDRMYHLAGGTSVYRRSPLQRIFRDVHVATQHMMVGPATLELTGRLLLGLETSEVGL